MISDTLSVLRKSLQSREKDYSNTIYYLAFLTMVLKGLCAYSELVSIAISLKMMVIGNLTFLFFLAYKIVLLQKYTIRQVVIFLIIGLSTIYTDRVTGMFMFMPDFLFLIATQDVNFKEIIRKTYKIEAIILAFHLAMYGFFWIFNRSAINFSVRIEASGARTIRHRLLLAHANSASMFVLWTILGYLYAEYESLNKKKIICAWGAYFLVYLLTDSNSGLIILTIVSMILLLKNIFGNAIDGFVSFLARYLFIILAVVFNIMMVIFTKCSGIVREIWMTINTFLTGRLLYGAYAYDKYGFSLLGQSTPNRKDYWQGMWIDSIPCDNAYMWFSVGYGVIYTLIIGYLFWKYSKYCKFEEKVMIIAYSLYMMMELYVTYMYYAFSVIMIMGYIWKSKSAYDNMIGTENGSAGQN